MGRLFKYQQLIALGYNVYKGGNKCSTVLGGSLLKLVHHSLEASTLGDVRIILGTLGFGFQNLLESVDLGELIF